MGHRRAPARRLLALIGIALFVALGAAPASAQPDERPEISPPDVAVLVDTAATGDDGATGDDPGLAPATRSALLAWLASIDGVARAVVDEQVEGATVFYLSMVEGGAGSRPLDSVVNDARRIARTVVPEATVRVGGSAVVDAALEDRYDGGFAALVVVGAVLGALAGLVFGWPRGVTSAITVALAVAFAGALAGRLIDPFDGTIAATPLPGALAGLLVGVIVTLRLLLWFRSPVGADGAETVRRAIVDLVPELILTLAAALVAGLVIDLLNPGRSAFLVPVAGAAVAMVVVLAVLPPALTVLAASSPSVDGPQSSWLPVSIPDGADLRLLALVAFGATLLGLSLFAVRSPSRLLLDYHDLPESHEAAQVARRLTAGGDPTTALVVEAGEANLPADFEGWAALAAERPDVAWVDTGSGRVFASGPADVESEARLVPAGTEGVAVVVPSVDARSAEGQQLVDRLAAIPLAGGAPAFSADAIRARGSESAGPVGVIAVALLAGVGALAAAAVTQSTVFAATTLLLRLLGGGATLGVFRLMVPEATAADSLTVVVLLGLGVGLFELEFARAVVNDGGSPDPSGLSGDSATRLGLARPGSVGPPSTPPNRGQAAAVGLMALGIGGVALVVLAPFGGGPGAGLFGLGLAVAVAVEFLVGLMILRPALLGQRAGFHTAVRPVRLALHSGNDHRSWSGETARDPTWRRIVDDLLQTEFRLQANPQGADLGTVFLEATPLHRQAVEHHTSMTAAGLRITGRCPQLQSVRTIGGGTQVKLAVTVDHPERNLVDEAGLVVGVRRSERRSGVLWLSQGLDGSYRIAESIELGAVPLGTEGPGDEAIDLDRLVESHDADGPATGEPVSGPRAANGASASGGGLDRVGIENPTS